MSGFGMNELQDLSRITKGRTRVATAENVYGKKGSGAMAVPGSVPQPEVLAIGQLWEDGSASRELGQGWKVRPCIALEPGKETAIMVADGPGVVRHIWITLGGTNFRDVILRAYWDGEENPSVEAPLSDFFASGMATKPPAINALPINVNPTAGANCYFPMPFSRSARITVENRSPAVLGNLFYAITWEELATRRSTPSWTGSGAGATTLEPPWAGSRTVRAGGEKGRSSSIWTGIRTSPASAVLVRRITSEVPGASAKISARRFWVIPREPATTSRATGICCTVSM